MPVNLSKKEKKTLSLAAAQWIRAAVYALDPLFFTPLRDVQVFKESAFSKFSGVAVHPALTPVIISISIFLSISSATQIFYKSEVTRLQKILDNLRKEFPELKDWYPSQDELEDCFNRMLAQRNLYHVQAKMKIKRTKKFLRREKLDFALKFEYSNVIQKLIKNNWERNKNKNILGLAEELFRDQNVLNVRTLLHLLGQVSLEDDVTNYKVLLEKLAKNHHEVFNEIKRKKEENDPLLASIDILPTLQCLGALHDLINKLFLHRNSKTGKVEAIKNKLTGEETVLHYELTLQESRQQALNNLNKIKMGDVAHGVYDTACEWSMNFWIIFFIEDLATTYSDTNKWNKLAQILVLVISGVTALFQWAASAWSKYRGRRELQHEHFVSEHKNPDLKGQLFRQFFLEKTDEVMEIRVQKDTAPLTDLENISANRDIDARLQAILAQDRTCKINKKKLGKKSVARHITLLKKEAGIEPITRFGFFRRAASIIVGEMAKHGIWFTFLLWLLGIIVVTIGTAKAMAAATLILGNPFALGAFCLGLVLGGILGIKQNRKAKKQREALKEQLTDSKDKIELLEKLEAENEALQILLKESGIKPLPVIEPHDDRAFRRATTKKTIWTNIKKIASRLFVAVDKLGGGIFLMRSFILPAIAIGASAAVASGPIGLAVALGFGVLWMGFNLYKHHYQKKLEVSKRLLDDIDNRVLAAQNQQKIYRKQLMFVKSKVLEPELAKVEAQEKLVEQSKAGSRFAKKKGKSIGRFFEGTDNYSIRTVQKPSSRPSSVVPRRGGSSSHFSTPAH